MIFIKGEDAMDTGTGLDATISVFIRYSELSAVKYDAKRDIIKIEIALNDSIKQEQGSRFINRCHQCMALYYNMTDMEPKHINLQFIENSGITILRLYRDSQTLREEEMELYVRLVRQEFASLLIRDDNNIVELAALSGDEKRNILHKIRQLHESYHNIFAYRDKGRLFVFNE